MTSDGRRLGDHDIRGLDIRVIDAVVMEYRKVLDELLDIVTNLNLSETSFKEVLFIEGAALDILLHDVEILLVMEKGVHFGLVRVVYLFVLGKSGQYLSPVPTILELLYHLKYEVLLG